MEKNLQASAKTSIVLLLLILLHTCAFAQNLDMRLLRSINHRTSSTDGMMVPITNSVYPITAAVPLSELAYGYAKHDSVSIIRGWQAMAGAGINLVVVLSGKYIVNRARPYISYHDINNYTTETDPSFPSGHTSFAFESATMLSLQYPKWYVVVPSYAWASTVGYSRMYLGMHYPSDVLVGAFIGSASAWLSIKGTQWLRGYKQKKSSRVE